VPDRAVVHRALAELEYLSFEGSPEELASRMKGMAADSIHPAPTARDSATV
jgi:hypothetical protein